MFVGKLMKKAPQRVNCLWIDKILLHNAMRSRLNCNRKKNNCDKAAKLSIN